MTGKKGKARAKKGILPEIVHEPGMKRSYVVWGGQKVWFYHPGYAGGGREVRFYPTSYLGPAVRLTDHLWREIRFKSFEPEGDKDA